MNKNIVNALSNYELKYDKNHAYGFINDYEVNIVHNPMGLGPVFMFSTFLSQTRKNEFILRMNSKKISFVQVKAFDFGVSVMIGSLTIKGFGAKCAEVLPIVLEILESLEAPKKDICPQSGEPLIEGECKTIVLPGSKIKIRLSNDAVITFNSAVEKNNEDFKNAPNHYLRGFGGILLGALAGVVATYLFVLIGIISAFSPIISIFLGVFLYKKFGGKQNHVMIIMSFITTAVALLGFITLIYTAAATAAAMEAGLPQRGLQALILRIDTVPEFRGAFFADMIVDSLMILVAEGDAIYRLVKMIQRPKGL